MIITTIIDYILVLIQFIHRISSHFRSLERESGINVLFQSLVITAYNNVCLGSSEGNNTIQEAMER